MPAATGLRAFLIPIYPQLGRPHDPDRPHKEVGHPACDDGRDIVVQCAPEAWDQEDQARGYHVPRMKLNPLTMHDGHCVEDGERGRYEEAEPEDAKDRERRLQVRNGSRW